MKDDIKLLVIVGLLIVVSIFNSGCLESRENKAIIMNMREFVNDSTSNKDYDSKIQTIYFKSLDEGDTVNIIDTIYNLTFVPYQEGVNMSNITKLVCKSVYEPNKKCIMPFEGNLTAKFKKGDKIKITLHIIEDTYQDDRYGTIWTVKLETSREGWDSEKNEMCPIPQAAINFA